jgi:hypothetical protein
MFSFSSFTVTAIVFFHILLLSTRSSQQKKIPFSLTHFHHCSARIIHVVFLFISYRFSHCDFIFFLLFYCI